MTRGRRHDGTEGRWTIPCLAVLCVCALFSVGNAQASGDDDNPNADCMQTNAGDCRVREGSACPVYCTSCCEWQVQTVSQDVAKPILVSAAVAAWVAALALALGLGASLWALFRR